VKFGDSDPGMPRKAAKANCASPDVAITGLLIKSIRTASERASDQGRPTDLSIGRGSRPARAIEPVSLSTFHKPSQGCYRARTGTIDTADKRAVLKTIPFFAPFTRLDTTGGGAKPYAEGWSVLDPDTGSARAAEYSVRAWLLAFEVPALSNPLACNGNGVFENAGFTDMQTECFSNAALQDGLKWTHSAFKEQPMEMVGELYRRYVEKGSLK